MKAFVTGGSGFIGQHLVRSLVAKGYDVYALARSERSAGLLSALGATIVPGDINDVASMRAGMVGSDVVFHLAAWYEIGASQSFQAEAVNVAGTRRVLRLAHELGVPKIVYASTVMIFGDTHGELVDETYFSRGPFLTEYGRTKWLAHYKVALPLIEKGAPIVIVMPGAVFGPGDPSILGQMMRFIYNGAPVLPGADTVLTYLYVDDAAEGFVLAAEKGKVGQSYILSGPAVPLSEMADFWGHLTGRRMPALRIAGRWIRPFAPLMGIVNSFVPLPAMFSEEATLMLGTTQGARSDKARQELGWTTRPLQTGMLETFNWIAETEPVRAGRSDTQRQRLAGLTLGAALMLFVWWLLGRNRK